MTKVNAREAELMEELRHMYQLLFRLERALASAEQIAKDTELVGGYFSRIHLTCSPEEVINRAIAEIEAGREETEK